MHHPESFRLPAGGQWKRYRDIDWSDKKLHSNQELDCGPGGGAVVNDGMRESDGWIYVFEGETKLAGDVCLTFEEIDPNDDIYEWLESNGIEQDGVAVVVLGDLHVEGELSNNSEDPSFSLYVEGDLHAGLLALGNARVTGDVFVSGYQFLDDGNEFRTAGQIQAKAIFLDQQASLTPPGKPAPGTSIYGGDELPLKPALRPEFTDLDYPLYPMKQAAKQGQKLLAGE